MAPQLPLCSLERRALSAQSLQTCAGAAEEPAPMPELLSVWEGHGKACGFVYGNKDEQR